MKRPDPHSVARLVELAVWHFLTYRLHPSAPFWQRALPRMAELRRPR